MAPDSTRVEPTAREFASRFGGEAFEDAAELLTDDGRENVVSAFPDEFRDGDLDATEALDEYWRGLYCQYGGFESVGNVTADGDEVAVALEFADGDELATVDVDGDGVAGFSFSPAYEVPDYVDRDAFAERDVTVDAGDVDLDGVLAVPEGDGPFPGVVLVHGHGIHDPDGTAGATKILKDVAWGLANEGIASLRYEKRLHEHEVADENYTLDAVVTDDAVAAASTLADADDVREVFVAGHSQGGTCTPRIADRHGDVTGVVILDAPTDPVVDPDDLTFLRYSLEPDGDLGEEQEEALETYRETFQTIAEGDFDDDEEIMGFPGVWHRSHLECDPMATTADLDVPSFVAKTGRADEELQADLAEARRSEFEKWRDAELPTDSRVEFYEDVGHYFQNGPTPVSQISLYFGGNVANYVVEDIAAWIDDVASSRSADR